MNWLDKYNTPKAKNGIEGTMGGLTDVPFNYNSAWGGQFQMGGNIYPANYIPKAQDGIVQKLIEDAKKRKGIQVKETPKSSVKESTSVKKRDVATEMAKSRKFYNQQVAEQKKEEARRASLTQEQRDREDYDAYNQERGVIQAYTPQSTASKTWDVLTNPITAFGYAARNENLPDNFTLGERNALDNAVDFVNPFAVANYIGQGAKSVGEVPGKLYEGDLSGAGESLLFGGLDLLEAVPFSRAALKVAKPGIKPAKNLLNKGLTATNPLGKIYKDTKAYTKLAKKIIENQGSLVKGLVTNKNFKFQTPDIFKGQRRLYDEVVKGAETLDNRISSKLQDLQSPEGMRRLVNQEKEYLEKIGFKGDVNEQALKNANSRIEELEYIKIFGNKNKEISQKFKRENFSTFGVPKNNPSRITFDQVMAHHNIPSQNAYYETPDNLIDDYIIDNSNGYYQLGEKPKFGKIVLGSNYSTAEDVADHEIAHALQRGRTLKIDDELSKLVPDYQKNLSFDDANDYIYFSSGSSGQEPSAFLAEFRKDMLDKGFIKNIYDPISPELVEEAITFFKKNPSKKVGITPTGLRGFSNSRIANFTRPTKENFNLLSKSLNKLPVALPVGLGLGAATQLGGGEEEVPTFQMGGSIPGSVGFTYARTGSIPSEGPRAKKTMPSAQNGQEMRYYQLGLDWKPKTISKNGGWLSKYEKAQDGRNIRIQNQEGDVETINTDSPEYRSLYKSGMVQSPLAGQGDVPYFGGELDEVVIQQQPREKGFWEQYRDKIVEENRDAGVLGAIIGTPISAITSLPQLAATYALTDKVQRPSEALDIQNPYGAFAVDVIADPTNLAGVGLADDALKLTSKGKNLFRKGVQSNKIISPEYLEGFKRTATKKLFDSRSANMEENLKRLKLLTSPKTLKAIGNVDAPIADKMLYEFMTDRYPSVKQFRTNVKKATLEANRIKKLNPGFDFSPEIFNHPDLVNHANGYLLSEPEYLSKFANAKKAAEKTIANKQNVKSFLEKEYVKKMDLINQDPILKNIAEESPQYVDDIYDYLKNPNKSVDEFVNDLIKQSNTFTRSMHKSMNAGKLSKEDFFTPKGHSMGFTGKNTIDVEGFPTSDFRGEYGKNKYKIFPNEERMADIASTPLEERWAKRFPNTFAGNENINFESGMHSHVENDFLHKATVQRRLRNNMLVNSGSASIQPKIITSDIIPYKYLYQPKHVVFNTPEQGALVKGFDVEQVSDIWKPFKPSGKFGLEPGYTKGFKAGGIIKDDRGQWAHLQKNLLSLNHNWLDKFE